MNKTYYNDGLDADDQISTEEEIAHIIFYGTNASEDNAAELSREILLKVITKFRPDLVNKENNDK